MAITKVTRHNTPAFMAYISSDSAMTQNVYTKIAYNSELYDADGCYDASTNYRFLPTTAGKYFLSATAKQATNDSGNAMIISIYENGSSIYQYKNVSYNTTSQSISVQTSVVVDADGSNDYYEVFLYQNSGTRQITNDDTYDSHFLGYKLIT